MVRAVPRESCAARCGVPVVARIGARLAPGGGAVGSLRIYFLEESSSIERRASSEMFIIYVSSPVLYVQYGKD